MENLEIGVDGFWRGRRVFITGHTGFKGSWLSLWLSSLGAEVHGYALSPRTQPNMFELCSIESVLESHTIGDVRDRESLAAAMKKADPEIVFHLAAQPLVRQSYNDPAETIETNVLGVMNLLEGAKRLSGLRALVNVTTDKVYENREWLWPYRENEALGGYDPYSASKACSEILTSSYRRSFFAPRGTPIATARAGNVIGGGDWSSDRLVPDFIRAFKDGRALAIRYPEAVRPWQHVLEVLSGYMLLAQKLCFEGERYADSWNLAPDPADAKSVGWMVNFMCSKFPGAAWHVESGEKPHEAGQLRLDASKAIELLGWRPVWNIEAALHQTAEWYQAWLSGADMQKHSLEQIQSYTSQMKSRSETIIFEVSDAEFADQNRIEDARGFFGKIFRVSSRVGRSAAGASKMTKQSPISESAALDSKAAK